MEEPLIQTPEPRQNLWYVPIARLMAYGAVSAVAYIFTALFAYIPLLIFGGRSEFLELAILTLAVAVASVVVTVGFVTLVDKRPIWTLGLSRQGSWAAELGVGVLIPVISITLLFFITYWLGWIKLPPASKHPSHDGAVLVILQSVILFVGVAIEEEITMRGYLFQTLETGYGKMAAVIVSSIVFASMHLTNPGAGFIPWVGILLAGLIFSYAYLKTRRLWLPIGIHFGWNFALGTIFGFPVSGKTLPSLINQTPTGPNWWLGGRFGPEAGAWVVVDFVLTMLAIWWFSKTFYKAGFPTAEPKPSLPIPEA